MFKKATKTVNKNPSEMFKKASNDVSKKHEEVLIFSFDPGGQHKGLQKKIYKCEICNVLSSGHSC